MTKPEVVFHYVKAVHPLDDFILLVEFDNHEIRYYDVKQCFDRWPVFRQLKENPDLFYGVKNEEIGVVFTDDIDLACGELYWGGRKEKY